MAEHRRPRASGADAAEPAQLRARRSWWRADVRAGGTALANGVGQRHASAARRVRRALPERGRRRLGAVRLDDGPETPPRQWIRARPRLADPASGSRGTRRASRSERPPVRRHGRRAERIARRVDRARTDRRDHRGRRTHEAPRRRRAGCGGADGDPRTDRRARAPGGPRHAGGGALLRRDHGSRHGDADGDCRRGARRRARRRDGGTTGARLGRRVLPVVRHRRIHGQRRVDAQGQRDDDARASAAARVRRGEREASPAALVRRRRHARAPGAREWHERQRPLRQHPVARCGRSRRAAAPRRPVREEHPGGPRRSGPALSRRGSRRRAHDPSARGARSRGARHEHGARPRRRAVPDAAAAPPETRRQPLGYTARPLRPG